MAPLPLCAQCRRHPVKKRDKRYCSVQCAHEKQKAIRPRCAAPGCPQRVGQKHNTFCSKRCAWFCRKGYEHAAKGRAKALAVNRAAYTKRLRERLAGMTSAAQIWRAAYSAGHGACYQSFLRKIRRGELIVAATRKVRDWNVA